MPLPGRQPNTRLRGQRFSGVTQADRARLAGCHQRDCRSGQRRGEPTAPQQVSSTALASLPALPLAPMFPSLRGPPLHAQGVTSFSDCLLARPLPSRSPEGRPAVAILKILGGHLWRHSGDKVATRGLHGCIKPLYRRRLIVQAPMDEGLVFWNKPRTGRLDYLHHRQTAGTGMPTRLPSLPGFQSAENAKDGPRRSAPT